MITIDYSLLIVIANFVLLLIILNKILYKPMKKWLTERSEKISGDIDEAARSKEEAAKILDQQKQELIESSEEIRKMQHRARREAEDQAKEILDGAKKQQKDIVQETEAQVAHVRKRTMEELEVELAGMIASVSATIIADKMDPETDKKLINKLLQDRLSK